VHTARLLATRVTTGRHQAASDKQAGTPV
jgi:hypothetical protein